MPVVKHLNANCSELFLVCYAFIHVRLNVNNNPVALSESVVFFSSLWIIFSNYGPTVDIAVQTKAKVTAQ